MTRNVAAKAIGSAALMVLTLVVPPLVGQGVAAPLPGFFANGWVGFLCVQGPNPFAPQTRIPILVQMNFDAVTNGGISLAEADQYFEFNRSNLPFLAVGATHTCALKPSQVAAQFNVNGLQAAQQLTGTFQQHGFLLYVIVNAFLSAVPSYLGQPTATLTVRSDSFLAVGPNNVTYTNSSEILQAVLEDLLF